MPTPNTLDTPDIGEPRVTVRLEAFGVPVDVRIRGSRATELRQAVEADWVCCLRGDRAADADSTTDVQVVEVLFDDDEAEVERVQESGGMASTRLDVLRSWLPSAVTVAAIGARSHDYVMLHAGAVADPATGRVAVLVGASGAGKTTAVRTLGERFAYVTDETVALTEDLRLLPYPKPLSLVQADPATGKAQHAPTELGLSTYDGELRLGAILLLNRCTEEEHAVPELDPLPTVEAIARIGEHTSLLAHHERPLSRLAAVIHAAGGAHEVHYTDARTLTETVADLLGAS